MRVGKRHHVQVCVLHALCQKLFNKQRLPVAVAYCQPVGILLLHLLIHALAVAVTLALLLALWHRQQ